MPDEKPRALVRAIRKVLPYTTGAMLLALLYLAWVFASRSDQNSRIEREAEARKAKADRDIYQTYGAGKLKILNFYAAPGIVARGGKALLCYGVANAKTVSIDPPIDRLRPALSRCIEVTPGKDTRYTLTAEDAEGHSATESFTLYVK